MMRVVTYVLDYTKQMEGELTREKKQKTQKHKQLINSIGHLSPMIAKEHPHNTSTLVLAKSYAMEHNQMTETMVYFAGKSGHNKSL